MTQGAPPATGDYSAIRGTARDPLCALRAYCRGLDQGIARARVEHRAAVEATVDALEAMHAAGIGHREAQWILAWAEHEVGLHLPGLDAPLRRALAGIRVRRLVLRGMLERLAEPPNDEQMVAT